MLASRRRRAVAGGIVVFLILLALLYFFLTRGAAAPTAPAHLQIYVGNVQSAPSGGNFSAAANGSILNEGDTIKTLTRSKAAVNYADGSLTRMDSDTKIQLKVIDHPGVSYNTQLVQSSGKTWNRVKSLVGGSTFKTQGPNSSTAEARGTDYLFWILPDGTIKVDDFGGSVDFTFAGKTVHLTAGQFSQSGPGGPTAPGPIPAADLADPFVLFNQAANANQGEDQSAIGPDNVLSTGQSSATQDSYTADGNSDLAFTLNWPGSTFGVILTGPDGTEYPEEASSTPPYTVVANHAMAGEWTYRVHDQISGDKEPWEMVIGHITPSTGAPQVIFPPGPKKCEYTVTAGETEKHQFKAFSYSGKVAFTASTDLASKALPDYATLKDDKDGTAEVTFAPPLGLPASVDIKVTVTGTLGGGSASTACVEHVLAGTASSISGTVSAAGLGVPNVTLTLTLSDGSHQTASTDSGGGYSFGGLGAGDYTDTMTVPAGYTAEGPTSIQETLDGAVAGAPAYFKLAAVAGSPSPPPTSPSTPKTNGKALILETAIDRSTCDGASCEEEGALAAGLAADIVSAKTFAGMTTAQFATYSELVFGDPNCGGDATSSLAAAIANPAWANAVTGNVLLIGAAPSYHIETTVINDAMKFAAADPYKTGAYISLSCYQRTAQGFLDVFRSRGFGVSNTDFCNQVHAVTKTSALAAFTDGNLDGWNCSAEEVLSRWPSDFTAIAISTRCGSSPGSGDVTAPDNGTFGRPYILARSTTPLVGAPSSLKVVAPTSQSRYCDIAGHRGAARSEGPPPTVELSLQNFYALIMALDAAGNPVPFTGTTTVSTSDLDPSVTLGNLPGPSQSVDLSAARYGQAKVGVRLRTLGAETISASGGGLAGSSLQVFVIPYDFAVNTPVDFSSMVAGTTTILSVAPQDYNGGFLCGYGPTALNFTSSDPQFVLKGDGSSTFTSPTECSETASGSAQYFTIYLAKAGNPVVYMSDPNFIYYWSQGSISVPVTAAAFSQFQASAGSAPLTAGQTNETELQVTPTDAYGNATTGPNNPEDSFQVNGDFPTIPTPPASDSDPCFLGPRVGGLTLPATLSLPNNLPTSGTSYSMLTCAAGAGSLSVSGDKTAGGTKMTGSPVAIQTQGAAPVSMTACVTTEIPCKKSATIFAAQSQYLFITKAVDQYGNPANDNAPSVEISNYTQTVPGCTPGSPAYYNYFNVFNGSGSTIVTFYRAGDSADPLTVTLFGGSTSASVPVTVNPWDPSGFYFTPSMPAAVTAGTPVGGGTSAPTFGLMAADAQCNPVTVGPKAYNGTADVTSSDPKYYHGAKPPAADAGGSGGTTTVTFTDGSYTETPSQFYLYKNGYQSFTAQSTGTFVITSTSILVSGGLPAAGHKPTPTPSGSPSGSPRPPVSPSPTPEVSPSATPAPSPDPTATPSPSPDPTATPSPDPTATPSPSPDPTPTPSPDPTPTPTPSPDATPTPSPDPTPTPSPDPTPTPSPDPTPTPSPDPTPTPSPDPSPTP